jgi:hypothetical protein
MECNPFLSQMMLQRSSRLDQGLAHGRRKRRMTAFVDDFQPALRPFRG